MTEAKLNPKVDEFLSQTKNWKEAFEQFREILLQCGLTEDFKWKHPCYTFEGKNIVLMHGFKDYCALLFHKGALLKDPQGILVQQTENVQSARQIRFTHVDQIMEQNATIKEYVQEAINIEKAGLKVEVKQHQEYSVPEELDQAFAESPDLKEAFETLTPGRQRAYLLHFSQPKQSKTRTARIEKNRPRILMGKGLTDCICGQSKRYPICDGSHKYLDQEAE
ncbi:DUF1801 domain-containing protein [Gracilibacillus alcaliphilus]|uniref:DUF1801 domain-containing protein n=1 Tax=Gracilibacillus alcaliphilus TaxID=1401441 RepID=UPI0019588DA5|nr:DUF1801 domain-containing protein [Gracilibacillus alcaliphilus]MBM7676691.1 uncharacterized protein YdeI (YjbR/CyaY-like superfamily) [Gracilibacillus alcaliphilus]